MRKKVDVLHVYAGTSGSAGTYLNAIYNSLKCNFNQEVFVSYYYPFNYGQKVFYRFSDLSSPYRFIKKYQFIRYCIRYAELIVVFIQIILFVIRRRVKVVNYSLTSDLNIEYWFLVLLNLFRIQVSITCHDVIPFGINSLNEKTKIRKKKRFFDIGKFLLVHNENSKIELINMYNIDKTRILMFPFPLMSLNDLPINTTNVPAVFKSRDTSTFRVGMVGHFRQEKGLDILLKAWDLFYTSTKKAELLLVGNFPNGIVSSSISTFKNIRVFDQFVDDSVFISVIDNCDLIVLPYIRGTNSGIPSSVISLDTLLITSDIEMFKNNDLINDSFRFRSENAVDLCNKIEYIYSLNEYERIQLVSRNHKLFENYQIEFDKCLYSCFKSMIN